jgi:insertion element IS1 protein InsB
LKRVYQKITFKNKKMECLHCSKKCIKKGKTKSDIQKYQCLSCKKYQRKKYESFGFKGGINKKVIVLLKESCGIRSIARVLRISTTTVMSIIKREAFKIENPKMKMNKEYEVDEIKTYVQNKDNDQWIIYAIDKKTRQVVGFNVGRRNKRNIKTVTETLVISKAKKICTDGLTMYRNLIPKEIHKVVPHNTNYIERFNLTLRTHLKRLSRRTICFSKSIEMLESCLRIYLWSSKEYLHL